MSPPASSRIESTKLPREPSRAAVAEKRPGYCFRSLQRLHCAFMASRHLLFSRRYVLRSTPACDSQPRSSGKPGFAPSRDGAEEEGQRQREGPHSTSEPAVRVSFREMNFEALASDR